MRTQVRVLSDEELAGIRASSLAVLEATGVRVDSARARAILADAGARVDEATRVVRFPTELVERSLAAAPRDFSLGGRRTGWSLPMNAGACSLVGDGEAVAILDGETGERRPATLDDWARATTLLDAAPEVGVYWQMVDVSFGEPAGAATVRHLADAAARFSKHIQHGTADAAETAWLLAALDVVYGGREAVRRGHPLSYLVCPVSPLVLEGPYTDAYLATLGWDIPIAVMPMPIMGLTAPVGLRSTIVVGDCEVLAMLCLVESAAPGTPFIYAPALAAMDPRTGRWGGGGIEHGLLGAAVTEVARGYGLPVLATTGSADHHRPGLQSAYERASVWALPTLSWPDLLVGPGQLSGATTLSLEQLVIDLEVFRRLERLHRGIGDAADEVAPGVVLEPVEAALADAGHGGDFVARRATRDAARGGEWLQPRLGSHDTPERWEASGRPELIDEAHAIVEATIAGHEPLPLDPAVVAELARMEAAARAGSAPPGAPPNGAG